MDSNKTLFTFGIISDTHLRNPAGDTSSPFPVNALANERAELAFSALLKHELAFIVHLGDMVHPLPHMPAYQSASQAARKLFDGAPIPIHYVPGNHDIGDKPMPGSPAAQIGNESITTYQKTFGQDYYHFEHQDCVFIVINSSLWNSGLAQERQQYDWLKITLDQNSEKRLFAFSHYPHFVNSPAEDEHYDNIAEPSRSKLLALFQTHRVESVFSGHVHNFFYNCTPTTQHYILPATSFVRQDYAELYRVSPTLEYGRDDPEKCLVTLVNVMQSDHSLYFMPLKAPSLSGTLKPSTQQPTQITEQTQIKKTQTSTSQPIHPIAHVPLRVHLRHPWYENIELPFNGPMEEFSRKCARNDYTLLRLWQIGIADVRVPITDITDKTRYHRVIDYRRAGIRFHAFGTVDQAKAMDISQQSRLDAIHSFELVISEDQLTTSANLLQKFINKPVYLSQATTGRDSENNQGLYFHSVSSGFLWPLNHTREQQIVAEINHHDYAGVVFQLPWEHTLDQLSHIDTWCGQHNLIGMINIRLAKQNPAESNFNDEAIAERLLNILETCQSLPSIELQLDTFVDIDRGYSPRNGIIDRHYNLRKVAHLLIQWSRNRNNPEKMSV